MTGVTQSDPSDELRRAIVAALGDIRLRLEQAAPTARDVHLARRAAKRVRALVKLASPSLEKLERHTAQAAGDARRRFAGARDADVRRATLEGLEQRLATRRDLLVAIVAGHEDDNHEPRNRDDIRSDVDAAIREWMTCDATGHADDIVAGAQRVYRKARRRAEAAVSGGTDELHRWRTAVVDHEYQCAFLSAFVPSLKAQAALADELRRYLGDINDLDELLKYVRSHCGDSEEEINALNELELAAEPARDRLLKKARRTGKSAFALQPARWVDGIRRSFAK
jgi:hypothetical protein